MTFITALMLAAAAFVHALSQGPPPELRATVESMRREGRLKAGEPAPDFDLAQLGSTGRVRLSSFTDRRPVALVFGSYT